MFLYSAGTYLPDYTVTTQKSKTYLHSGNLLFHKFI